MSTEVGAVGELSEKENTAKKSLYLTSIDCVNRWQNILLLLQQLLFITILSHQTTTWNLKMEALWEQLIELS